MGMRILWLSPFFNPGLHPQVVFHGGNIPWYFRCILILSLFNMSWFSIHYFPAIFHYTMVIFHHIFHYIPIMISIDIALSCPLHSTIHIYIYTYHHIYIYNGAWSKFYIYIYPHGIPMIAHENAAFEVDPGRDQLLGPGWGLQEPPPRITGRFHQPKWRIFLWKMEVSPKIYH